MVLLRLKMVKEKHIGDPTETSIVLAAHKNGMEKDALNAKHPAALKFRLIPTGS